MRNPVGFYTPVWSKDNHQTYYAITEGSCNWHIDVIPNLNENEYYFYYKLRKSISVLGICLYIVVELRRGKWAT